jgi:hypothetical protein
MTAGKKAGPDFVRRHEEHSVFETDTFRITASTSIREVPFPNMDGPAYLIEYLGKDGKVTTREIIIQWISQGRTNFWITAFCKLRKEVRKFNSENIVSMLDCKSGLNIVDPAKHLRHLDKQGF